MLSKLRQGSCLRSYYERLLVLSLHFFLLICWLLLSVSLVREGIGRTVLCEGNKHINNRKDMESFVLKGERTVQVLHMRKACSVWLVEM